MPRIETNTGARAFSSCTPCLWNNLPLSVRSATSVATFRRRLETYLFDLVSPPPVDTGVANGLLCYEIAWTTSHLNNNLAVAHWGWLRRGYWRYRNLIDWLIDSKDAATASHRLYHLNFFYQNTSRWSFACMTSSGAISSGWLRFWGLMAISQCTLFWENLHGFEQIFKQDTFSSIHVGIPHYSQVTVTHT